jgi:hypothetical protein
MNSGMTAIWEETDRPPKTFGCQSTNRHPASQSVSQPARLTFRTLYHLSLGAKGHFWFMIPYRRTILGLWMPDTEHHILHHVQFRPIETCYINCNTETFRHFIILRKGNFLSVDILTTSRILLNLVLSTCSFVLHCPTNCDICGIYSYLIHFSFLVRAPQSRAHTDFVSFRHYNIFLRSIIWNTLSLWPY